MVNRIAVSTKISDARAQSYLHTLQTRFPESGLKAASLVQVYTVDAKLSAAELDTAAQRLTNQITEMYSTEDVPTPVLYAYAIEIWFLPGVTDNVGKTARQTIEDCLDRSLKEGEDVYSSKTLFLDGAITARDVATMAHELHNPLIERASVFSKAESGGDFPIVVPKVSLMKVVGTDEVDLGVSDAELLKIGKEGIADKCLPAGRQGTRRGPLSLSLRALKIIRGHFEKVGRNPTDENWNHWHRRGLSITSTRSLLIRWMRSKKDLSSLHQGGDKRIRKQRARKISAFPYLKIILARSHSIKNISLRIKWRHIYSPSALDPFGGSVTAIVGVNRDCLGFGLGAKPIANTYGFS